MEYAPENDVSILKYFFIFEYLCTFLSAHLETKQVGNDLAIVMCSSESLTQEQRGKEVEAVLRVILMMVQGTWPGKESESNGSRSE